MTENATCETCNDAININEAYIVFPPAYNEWKPHIQHLNCYLRKYRELEH